MSIQPRFSVTQLLLTVTWSGVIFAVAARYFAPSAYIGNTHDIAGSKFFHTTLGETTSITISDDLVANSPSWHPADENPPVSARAALAIADNVCREKLRDKKNWKWGLNSITLLPIDGKHNKWCWKVDFTAVPVTGGLAGGQPWYSVYVLMNGTIIRANAKEHVKVLEDMDILEDATPTESHAE